MPYGRGNKERIITYKQIRKGDNKKILVEDWSIFDWIIS